MSLQVPIGLILGGILGGAARCIVDGNDEDKSNSEIILLGIIASFAGIYVLPFPIPEHLKVFDFLKLVSFGIIAGLMGEILLGRVKETMFPDARRRKRAESKSRSSLKFFKEYKGLAG